jgi:hypothetical protein
MPSTTVAVLSTALLAVPTAGLAVKGAAATPALGSVTPPNAIHAGRDSGEPAWLQARHPCPLMRSILREAALRHHVDPKLVLALSY